MKIRLDGFWAFLTGGNESVLRARIRELEGIIDVTLGEQEARVLAVQASAVAQFEENEKELKRMREEVEQMLNEFRQTQRQTAALVRCAARRRGNARLN